MDIRTMGVDWCLHSCLVMRQRKKTNKETHLLFFLFYCLPRTVKETKDHVPCSSQSALKNTSTTALFRASLALLSFYFISTRARNMASEGLRIRRRPRAGGSVPLRQLGPIIVAPEMTPWTCERRYRTRRVSRVRFRALRERA